MQDTQIICASTLSCSTTAQVKGMLVYKYNSSIYAAAAKARIKEISNIVILVLFNYPSISVYQFVKRLILILFFIFTERTCG